MNVAALDLETHPIKPGCVAPRMVCLTKSQRGVGAIYDRKDGLALAWKLLRDQTLSLVGHHIFFDLCVMVAEEEEMLPLIFAEIDAGRIRDTKIRQMIIDNAEGKLKFVFNEETGEYNKQNYQLYMLVMRHLHRDIKHLKKGDDVWRLRFNELDGLPVVEYPPEASTYAIGDAVDTEGVFLSQEDYCAPHGLPGGLEAEIGQTQAAWALYLTGAWGVRTDPAAVAKLKAEVTADFRVAVEVAQRHGFIRRGKKESKNQRAIRDAIADWYGTRQRPMKYTTGGKRGQPQIGIDREQLTEIECLCGLNFHACPCKPHENDGIHKGLWAVAESTRLGKLLSTYISALERGTIYPLCSSYNAIIETFRTSCSQGMKINGVPMGCNLQNPPRKHGVRECFVPRAGWSFIFCDLDTIEMRTLAQTCIELFGYSHIADAIKAGKDLHLDLAADMMEISYEEALERFEAGDAEVAENRQFCFHPDTEALTHDGWKKIGDLKVGETVAAAIPSDDGTCRLEWQPAQALSRRKAPELIHLKSEGIDLRVTPEHRMLGFRTDGRAFVTTPEKLSKARTWCNAGVAPGGDWEPDEKLLRLAVATQADGSLHGSQIRFGFTKQRKIDRMRAMLADVPHRESVSSQGATQFFVFGDPEYKSGRRTAPGIAADIKALLTDKKFDERWTKLSQRGRQIVLGEAKFWDATQGPKSIAYAYCSMIKSNAEILQIIATLEGRKTRLVQDKHNKIWKLTVRQTHRSRGDIVQATKLAHDGDVVCLSVPSTFVLVRDGGIPVITGNCKIGNYGFAGGMAATTFVAYAKGFGVVVSPKLARQLHAAFRSKWAEMNDYFAFISSLVGDGNRIKTVTFPKSNLMRGDVTYTAAANGFFQHRAAMGAKAALYQVVRECYLKELNSPLYGCRPWLFAHDEIGLECPYIGARASAAALRLQEVMITVVHDKWCPDVPIGATACMTRRWYKGAKSVFVDASGNVCKPDAPGAFMVPSKPEDKKWVHDPGEERMAA